jgi:protein-tyrosine-phosphatase
MISRALHEMALSSVGRISVFRQALERWAPLRLPNPVRSVLFVCKANICRSPLAAAYFQSLVQKNGVSVTVKSAGLETNPGIPAQSNIKIIAGQQQLSLDTHATTQLHRDLVNQSDLIIVMEISQKDRIHRMYPQTKGKVVLLGSLDSRGPLEIADPYGGSLEEFRICFEQIKRCCNALIEHLGARQSCKG